MPTLNFADTKGTCHLAYEADTRERYTFPDGIVWKVLDKIADWSSGFRAILIQPENRVKNVTVLAFAGTSPFSLPDILADIKQAVGGLPNQYTQALLFTQSLQKEYGNLYLTGHSLGGGLAAYSSVHTNIPASTINPAPLVGAMLSNPFTLLPNNQITNYISGGSEFVSSSPGRNPGRDVQVGGNGGWFAKHTIANTAPQVNLPQPANWIQEAANKVRIEAGKRWLNEGHIWVGQTY